MASNLNKGYQDIGTTTTRTTTRPGKPTATGRPRQQVVRTPIESVPAKEPPTGKAKPKQKYERMEEKDTASHRISESRTEIKDQYEKFKAQLDKADRDYFNARKRVDIYGSRGMVRTDEELQYAEDLKRWQEDSKVQFKNWVDSVIERNRVNTKAPGTFNNMLDDAEEAFEELDSRRSPEQYRTDRQASSRAARIEKAKLLPAEPKGEDRAVSSLGGLFGPEGQTGSQLPVGPDGKPLFTAEELAASADKSGYDQTSTNVKNMFTNLINTMADKSGMSDEKRYQLKQQLDKNMELVSLQSQIANQKRALQAKPEEKGFLPWLGKVVSPVADVVTDVGGRGLDLLSRANYAAANIGEDVLLRHGLRNPGVSLGEGWKGITGEKKNSFMDVLAKRQELSGNPVDTWWEKAGVGVGGTFLDIATDPTTYTSFGVTSAGKAGALKAAEALAEGASRGRILKEVAKEAFPTVRRNIKPLTETDILTRTAKFQEDLSKLKRMRDAANKVRKSRVLQLQKQGIAVGADEQRIIFNEALDAITKTDAAAYEAALRAGAKPRMAVRFAGKDIGDIPRVGRALEKAHVPASAIGKAYKSSGFGRTMSQMFNMKSHFPGLTDRLRRVVESRGLVRHNEFQKKVDDILKGLTREERKTISHNIEAGGDLTGTPAEKVAKDLGDVQRQLIELNDEMWNERVSLGMNKPDQKGNNFLFHYYKGTINTSPEAIKAAKAKRKALIRGHQVAPTLAEAKSQGLNPYEDIGDILKLQHADHQRKVSRHWFKHEVIDEYGLLTDNADVAKSNNLVKVTDKLTPELKEFAKQQGKDYYLHKDIKGVFDKLDSMHSLATSEEFGKFMRYMTRATNWWKGTATVWNPGNWINNSIGDVFLNYFDGMQNPKWYKRSFDVIARGLVDDKVIFKLGSHKVTRQEAWELYKKWGGSAGFLRAEVDEGAFRFASRPRHAVHNWYQKREDFSRFAHFIYSLEDEFKRVPRSGRTKLLAKRIDQAAAAASDRVAKFNIDYSAFTPTERKIKGGAVPFYSWMRKAFPLMLENMFMRPGRYTAQAKAVAGLERSLGVEPEYNGEYGVEYPQWLKDQGMIRLTGGRNPTVIKNPLPTNIFGNILGGGSFSDMVRQNMGNLHPALQLLPEIGSGETLFSGQKIGEPADYIASKFPLVSTLEAIRGKEFFGDQENIRGGQRLGKLLGSKPYDITDARQISELRRQQDPLDTQMSQMNKEIYPIKVEKSGNGYVIINAENNRKFDKTFSDPKDAYQLAMRLKKAYGGDLGMAG